MLSLEEMLAEGDGNTRTAIDRQNDAPPTLNKTQIKCLQEAMYHSAENNHLGSLFIFLIYFILRHLFEYFLFLDITIELRALGVSIKFLVTIYSNVNSIVCHCKGTLDVTLLDACSCCRS